MSNSLKMLAGLAVSGTLAMAQAPQIELHFGVTSAHESLKKVTHASTGLLFGGSLRLSLPGTNIPVRYSLSAGTFPGRQHGTIKSNLGLLQAAVDVSFSESARLNPFFGIALNKWRVQNSGTETITPDSVPGKPFPQYVWAVSGTKGVKAGLRMGVDYGLTAQWTVQALVQVSELGGGEIASAQPTATTRLNLGSVNPSWFQIGARYTF